jgi:hypothetical protein
VLACASHESKRLSKPVLLAIPVLAVAIIVPAVFLPFAHTSAVQAPNISLDMVTTGNTYDDTTNTMTVGAVDSCSTDAIGNNDIHIHAVDVVIQDVEDLIAWQIRLNYDGGKMRPSNANFQPFTDNTTGQQISFVNLPIDAELGVHRDITGASNIPAAAPGLQTALIGSSYLATQTAPVSPDAPAKPSPDDTSYSAPIGGVLAILNLQILAGNAGQLLSVDLDDGTPNTPGSKAVVFTGSGQRDVLLTEGDLGDGVHAEGVPCVAPTAPPTPTTAPGASTSTGAGTSTAPSTPGGSTGTSPTAAPSGGATPAGSQGADGGGWSTWVYFVVAGGLVLAVAAVTAALRLRSRARRGGG